MFFRQLSVLVIWTATTLVIGVKRQRIIYIEPCTHTHTHTYIYIYIYIYIYGVRGGVMVNVLRYKPAYFGFDSRWCHGNFSVTQGSGSLELL